MTGSISLTLPPDELVKLPVALAVENGPRRLALATTSATRILEHDDYFLQRQPCEVALDNVPLGIVPLLLEHNRGDRWNVEHQLGTVRESRLTDDGETIELVVEFGANPKGEWIYSDLRAGHIFGCSINMGIWAKTLVPPPLPLPKPLYRVDAWRLRELTICAAQGGRDGDAKLRWSHDAAELLDELKVIREVREEMMRYALPGYHADPLRRRLPAIAAAVAQAGVDPRAIEAALAAEIEAFIADAR